MSNIVDFMARLRAKAGDAAFMCCPACGGEDLAVVVRWSGPRPFIAALVCAACETEVGVLDGTPVGWRAPETPSAPGQRRVETSMEAPMRDEDGIEAEIQEKGLTAPRLTPAMIDEVIVAEQYHVFPGTTLTVCCLTLRNGFCVTGESAAASAANFDAELGRRIARDAARNRIWALEGYLLRERLSAPRPA